jgi:hypothetical protein
VCCIGVPYATHVWQIADASELNGLFKIELGQANQEDGMKPLLIFFQQGCIGTVTTFPINLKAKFIFMLFIKYYF